MSKREQILILKPASEIKFKGPYTEVVTRSLELTNPSEQRVAFKIKTTTPKRYCVRPNSGTLNPQETASVLIMLQPYDQEGDMTKHKFMVQSIFLSNNSLDPLTDNYWKTAGSETLMDTKLKCVFEDDDSPKTSSRNSGGTGDIEKFMKADVVSTSFSYTPMFQALTSQVAPVVDVKTEKLLPDQSKDMLQEFQEMRSELDRVKKNELRLRNAALETSFSTATKLNSSSATSIPRYGREPDDQVSAYKKITVLVLMVLIGILLGKMLF